MKNAISFQSRLLVGMLIWLLAKIVLMAAVPSAPAFVVPKAPIFELRDGDRVILVGDTFVEREQQFGYIETRLTARFHDRRIQFRNLGWSGDTPAGRSRASFDFDKPSAAWLSQLSGQIAALKPTVVILAYGMANSFDGEAGLVAFKDGMEKLIETIKANDREGGVRFLMIGSIPHEALSAPFPDPAPHNKQLQLYNVALKEIADKRGIPFVSLFDQLQRKLSGKTRVPLTDNGIHLNAYGYKRAAEAIESSLGYQANGWRFGVLKGGGLRDGSSGIRVDVPEWKPEGFNFTMKEDQLMTSILPGDDGYWPGLTPNCSVQFLGLGPGQFALKVDGDEVDRAGSVDWASGRVSMRRGPQLEQVEELRRAIVRKNELFFHQWRPANQTYLFGFRKHEQGQNAAEIARFEPLIADAEAEIEKLKHPVTHHCELIWIGEIPSDADRVPKAKAKRESRPRPEGNPVSAGVSNPQPRPEFEVAPGFEVNLFAENPLLAKPIQMNFDPQGRLWIASSSVYPQIQPGASADDKIVILEDNDHDGVADKSTVFADGLLIPTGIEPGDGGAYVGQSSELLFLKDTDGDGKADIRRTVLSGFGTEDTHHILHTLHWGMDGHLYMNQSIYIHSHVETPWGVRRLNSGGVWRFQTGSQALEVFLKGFCNPWGHDFDGYGQSFVTDGAGFQGLSWGIPGAMYFTYADSRRLADSISPGTYPKFCGLELVASRQFPEEWQGNALTCDFRAHRVARFSIHENGSGYSTQQMPDVLRSTNVTFRPIDLKFGPDGALYIADWSNPIIQHGEVDFRDPRRDRVHGRIWRVKARGNPADYSPNLPKLATSALLANLLSNDGFLHQQSRRVLTERGLSILPDLQQWTDRQNSDKARLQGLWLYQSLNRVPFALVQQLLNSKDPNIRAAATRVLGVTTPPLPDALELLKVLSRDESSRVRVEAARALARNPSAEAAETVLAMLDMPVDSFLDYALWLSINDLAEPWIQSVEKGAWTPAGREKQFAFAVRAIDPTLAGRVVSLFLKSNPVPGDGSGPTLELIAQAGGPAEIQTVLSQALSGGMTPQGVARVIQSLASAARSRQARPATLPATVKPFLQNDSEPVRLAAIGLAGAWRNPDDVEPLLSIAGSMAHSETERIAAIGSLREISGSSVTAGLQRMAGTNTAAAIRAAAVQGLAALDPQGAAPLLLSFFQSTTREEDALPLWRTILSTRGGGAAMLKILPKTGLGETMAKAGIRVAREGGRSEPELILALSLGAGLSEESHALSEIEMKQLVQKSMAEGDPQRGELVYRRPEAGCVACHAIGGAGGKVGPDLTSIGASAPMDYLIESVLYPSRKIKEGYHSILLETTSEEEFAGILVRESGDEVLLRDINNRVTAIAKSRIKTRRTGGSLMPSGLVDPFTPTERMDLYRFLSELGKPGRFDASKGNVARHWWIRAGFHTGEQFGEEKLFQGVDTDKEWSTIHTLVDGTLSAESLKSTYAGEKYRGVTAVYAAAKFQSPRNGPVLLNFGRQLPEAVWVDGKPVGRSSELSVALESGVHQVVLKFVPGQIPDHLRLSCNEVTFLTE